MAKQCGLLLGTAIDGLDEVTMYGVIDRQRHYVDLPSNEMCRAGRSPMHARLVHANISDLAEAKRGLDEEVIPMIKGPPGFVGAYFVAVDDTHGISIEVFETEEQARVFSPPVGAEAPGVTVDAIQFGAVIGSA